MTDIETRAEQYAKDRLENYPSLRILRGTVFALIAEAYEQGYMANHPKETSNNE